MACEYCIHANYDKMKCYPDSEDCKSEYDLVEKRLSYGGKMRLFSKIRLQSVGWCYKHKFFYKK